MFEQTYFLLIEEFYSEPKGYDAGTATPRVQITDLNSANTTKE
jgi:hypothetical protein